MSNYQLKQLESIIGSSVLEYLKLTRTIPANAVGVSIDSALALNSDHYDSDVVTSVEITYVLPDGSKHTKEFAGSTISGFLPLTYILGQI